MNELSLFSGAGSGLLATKWMLGWRTIGYVEWDDYCQKVIAQRIKDGLLDPAPIFGDIRAFIGEGYAERYRGMVDIITAGFPCQPFSVAGKQKGPQDERNMWPATIECLRIIRPQYALLENVPGLLVHPYARQIFGDLAEVGMDAKWGIFSACSFGATHTRKRLFILAYSNSLGCARSGVERKQSWRTETIRAIQNSDWRKIATGICRMDHAMANRMDRLKAIGNGQVPAVVARVWEILNA